MSNLLSIPCPDCKTPIQFSTYSMLSGMKFNCPNCQLSIGLASESKPMVQSTMEKFEKLKEEILVDKKKNNLK